MAYSDKTLVCAECGSTFVFTAGEQEFFASKGYIHEPKRCPSCRQARRSGEPLGMRGERRLYPAVCARCGAQTEVPFQPRGDRPVYCSTCFAQVRPPSRR